MKLIVGLGNPGESYSCNRHNIGFMCINHFARIHKIKFDKKQGLARIGTGSIDGIPAVLARPQTYMNSSGESVSRLMRNFKVAIGDLIVIHDDLDLSFGRMRIRRGGSSAGHKGVQSIINQIGTPDFIRVRVGIGHPLRDEDSRSNEDEVISYVLNDFTPEEEKEMATVIPQVSAALLCLLTDGLEAAMNRFNQAK